MLNQLIEKFQRRMLELGCSRQSTRRAATELREHYEDLVQVAIHEGIPESLAKERAATLLGEPLALAERAAEAVRHGSWCGRHPVITCCVLAPLALIPTVAAVLLLCVGLYGIGHLIKGPAIDPWLSATMGK